MNEFIAPQASPIDHEWMEQVLPLLQDTVRVAGDAIMEIYKSDFSVSLKADQMPVTKADQCAEIIIIKALKGLSPSLPIVAEEDCSENGAPQNIKGAFWLVDPLDGTREFMARNGEFTVNIGLIIDNKPAMGIIYAPATKIFYYGIKGVGAWKQEGRDDGSNASAQPIHSRMPLASGHIMISSRRHGDLSNPQELLGDIKLAGRENIGSSLKFCLLAEGKGDIYPRLGRTMEWDTAAGQAILEAAGGRVVHLDGSEFLYNKHADFANPSFLAWGK